MKKYYLLFNVDNEVPQEDQQVDDLLYYLDGEAIIQNVNVHRGIDIDNGKSLWVTEPYYTLAHSLLIFDYIRKEGAMRDENQTVRSAEKWFELNKNTYILR